MFTSRGCGAQHGDCGEQYCIVYWKVAKTVDLRSSHHKKKNV